MDGFDTSFNGTRDGFHAQLTPDLTTLEYGTFIGGSDEDWAHGPFLLGGYLHLHGSTKSTDFPTTAGAYDETHNGRTDGFITRLVSLGPPQVPVGSQRARWITGGLLFALVGFAAWRMSIRAS